MWLIGLGSHKEWYRDQVMDHCPAFFSNGRDKHRVSSIHDNDPALLFSLSPFIPFFFFFCSSMHLAGALLLLQASLTAPLDPPPTVISMPGCSIRHAALTRARTTVEIWKEKKEKKELLDKKKTNVHDPPSATGHPWRSVADQLHLSALHTLHNTSGQANPTSL